MVHRSYVTVASAGNLHREPIQLPALRKNHLVAVGRPLSARAGAWEKMTSTRTGSSDSSSIDPLWGAGSSSARHKNAMRAMETTNEVLRRELLAVEMSWAEEHASLLEQLEAKDQQIWSLAQQLSDAAAAAPAPHQPPPPRLGRRERPKSVPIFPLREAGAMVLTPAKRNKPARPPAFAAPKAPAGPKPAWGEGHAGGKTGAAAQSQMASLPPGMGLGDLAKAAKAAKAAKGGPPPKGAKAAANGKGAAQGATKAKSPAKQPKGKAAAAAAHAKAETWA